MSGPVTLLFPDPVRFLFHAFLHVLRLYPCHSNCSPSLYRFLYSEGEHLRLLISLGENLRPLRLSPLALGEALIHSLLLKEFLKRYWYC